jgi:hypothetical protein
MYPLLRETTTCHYGIIYAYMHKKNQRPELGATSPKHYVGEPSVADREEAAKEVKIAAVKRSEKVTLPKASPAPRQDRDDESPTVKPIEEDVVPYKL